MVGVASMSFPHFSGYLHQRQYHICENYRNRLSFLYFIYFTIKICNIVLLNDVNKIGVVKEESRTLKNC